MKYISFINGTIVFLISDKAINRLINICTKNNLLFVVKNQKNGYLFYIPFREKTRFISFLDKLLIDYKIIKEKGIPILYFKYKIRYWVLLFLSIILIVLWKFSLYIWCIEITGTTNHTREELLEYVSKILVPLGTKKSEIDCNRIEEELRQKYVDLGWIDCSVEGTKLKICVLETIPQDNKQLNTSPCNIIANKDSTVYEAIATNGYLLVEKGKNVKKGDVLITGIMPKYNDYGEETGTRYEAANGTIYGIVSYNYNNVIDLEQTIKYPIKEKTIYSICLGGLLLSKEDIENTFTEYRQFKIGKTYYLPIAICKKKVINYSEKHIHLTETEAKELANVNLQKYIEDLRKKSVVIMQNNVKIHIENGQCIAVGQILCKEQIGIAIPINCEDQGEE